jgi:polysaccharide biosynthesis protein PslH
MNILVISSQLPYPFDNGALARLYNIYSRLGQEHQITWLCPIWDGTEANIRGAEKFVQRVVPLPRGEQRPLPTRGWKYLLLRLVAPFHWARLFVFCFGYVEAPGLYWMIPSPERLEAVKKLVGENKFDLIMCEFEGNAELVGKSVKIPKAIMTHNVQSGLFTRIRKMYGMGWEDRLFYLPELLKVIWYERMYSSRFQLGITVSREDQKVLQHHSPGLRVEMIPNGVDLDFYRPTDTVVQPKTLVYIGNYSYPPNADAALYYCESILPLIRSEVPDIHTVFVGMKPPEALKTFPGVETTGFVQDIRPFVAQAGCVIVPLRVGGGTRLKILDSLAMGKAIVSTSLGAEGIDLTHGKDILLADRPDDFARCVTRLVNQPDFGRQLGENGRNLVERKYSWDVLVDQLTEYLQEIIDRYPHEKA